MVEIGKRQRMIVEGERPSRKFLEIIYTLVAQGKGQLRPKGPGLSVGDGVLLGWFDASDLFLLAEGSFQQVSQFCRASGEGFPVRETRLRRDLLREGLLVPTNVTADVTASVTAQEAGRMTTVVRIGDRTHRVLRLSLGKVAGLLGFDILKV